MFALAAAASWTQVAAPTPEQAPAVAGRPAPVTRPPWQELDYRARRFFLTAHTEVKLDTLPAASAMPQLRAVPSDTARRPGAAQVALLTLATDLPFGRDETVTLWLDPDGTAMQLDKVQTGSSPYRKLLRFTADGYHAWRWAPADDRQERLSPERWTRRKEHSYAASIALPGNTVVTDPYALLYLVSAARLDRAGSHLDAVIFADDRPVVLGFEALGLAEKRVAFEEEWPGGSRRRDEPVLVRDVRMIAHALDQAAGDTDVELGFLDMRGTLAIAVEVGTGIPVELSGRTVHLGNLTVRLDRAVLREPPAAANPAPAPTAPP